MDISQIKEELSISYISTIAAMAGIDYEIMRHDDDSADGLLKKCIYVFGGRKFNSSLHVQLKCTSSISQYNDDGKAISYKLKAKNYNDLCAPSTTPIILALLIIPENQIEWINWTPEDLMLKGCMYWLSLANNEETNNTGFVTIKIPKSNALNCETLHNILEKIAREEDL